MSVITRVRRSSGTADTSPETSAISGTRLVYFDRLRIGLTVLVVLHHVAMAYGAGGLAFYYVDPPDGFFSRNLLVFVLLNQAWFMGAFFLVAGYFTPGSLDRKGTEGFLRSRLLRLGIPLAIYAAMLNPIAMTGWFHVEDQLDPMTWATFDYFENVRMGPAWFLALLLLFSVGYAIFRSVSPSVINRRRAATSDTAFPGVISVAGFILVLAGLEFLLRTELIVGESWAGFPSLAYFPQYAAFFVVGMVAYRRNWQRALPLGTGLVGLGAAAASSVLLFPLAFSGNWFSLELSDAVNLAMGGGNWQSAVYALWDSTLSVGLCLGLVVLLRGIGNRDGATGRFLAANSYGTYLVHIPIVVYTAVLLSGIDFSHTGRLVIAAAVAVPASFVVAAAIRQIPGAARVL